MRGCWLRRRERLSQVVTNPLQLSQGNDTRLDGRPSNALPRSKWAPLTFSAFRNVPVPAILPAEEGPTLRDLFKGRPADEYSAGAAIFWEGDPADQIFDIADGVLRVYRILADGRRAIVGFIYPGGVLGVASQRRYLFTAEAVTDVKVRRFSRGRFFSVISGCRRCRPRLLRFCAMRCPPLRTRCCCLAIRAPRSA